MAHQKAISGNPEKKNSSTIMFAGTKAESNSAGVNAILPSDPQGYGSVVATTVSAASSGNLGVMTVVNGTVNKLDEYIVRGLADTIAGQANDALKSGSSDFGQGRYPRPIEFGRRLDEDSWNAADGELTKGGAEGAQFLYHGSTDHALSGVDQAAPANFGSNYGEFTIAEGKALPTNKDYERPKNP